MEEIKNTQKEANKIIGNFFYSFLSGYSKFGFSLIFTFLIARILSISEWGDLMLNISTISIVILLLNFLPPGLHYSLNYYIPKYNSENKISEIKTFIIKSLIIKILILIPFYLIFLLIITLILPIFFNNNIIIIILSPQIIITSLNIILISIFHGFKLFKTQFYIELFSYSFKLFVYLFLIFTNNSNLIVISTTLTLVTLFNFIFMIFFLIKKKKIFKLEKSSKNKYSFFKKNLTYGLPRFLYGQIGQISNEIKNQSIGFFLQSSSLTIYTLGERILQIPLTAPIGFQKPTLSHFTEMIHNKKERKVENFFRMLIKLTFIITCCITGTMIIILNIFFQFLFPADYLQFIFYFQIILLSSVFMVFGSILIPLLGAKNKVKILPFLSIFYQTILMIFFWIGIANFQLYGYAITLFIASVIIFILELIIARRLLKFKIYFKEMIIIITSFFTSLIISRILIPIFFLPKSHILSDLIILVVFILIFFLELIVTKIITKKETHLFISIIEKRKSGQFFLNIFKKIKSKLDKIRHKK